MNKTISIICDLCKQASLNLLRTCLLFSSFAITTIAPATSTAQVLEEIVVTARKREDSLQETAVAVTALSGEALEALGVQRLDEMTAMAPNLRIQSSGTGPSVATLFIRGIGYNGTEKLDAPSVGVFIDDFYWGMGHGQLVDTFDVESVEILRGPQSVLFGRNTSGGAVVVRRAKPLGVATLKSKIGFGDYGQKNIQAVFHTPEIGDTLAAKIGYTRKDREGFADNLYDGTDEGENTYEAIHAMVSWDPVDSLSLLFVFDDIKERGEATPLQNNNPLGQEVFFGGVPLVGGVDHLDVWPDLKSDQKLDANRYSLKLDWETSFGTISSITAYLDEEDITLQDFDSGCGGDSQGLGCPFTVNPLLVSASNPTGTLHTIRDQEFREFTQELRIDGDITDTLNYQAGGFYYRDEIESRQTTNFAAFDSTKQETESYALFARFSWEATPGLTLSAGLQRIEEEKEFEKTVSLVPALGGFSLLPLTTAKKQWDDTVYQAGAEWIINDDYMAYLTLSDGFRSGGFSQRGTGVEAFDPSQPNFTGDGSNFLSFDPETTREYEFGLKTILFDGTMNFNFTVFRTELEGLQRGAVMLTPGFPINTNTIISNLQESIYQGYELELIATVPGVEGLTVVANYGYLDAEVKKALIPATRLGVGPGGIAGSPAMGSIDLADTSVLTQSPDFTYALGLNYERKLGTGWLRGALQWSYTDDIALASLGSLPDTQEGYGLLSASLSYGWKQFEFRLTGKNLTDEEYRGTSLANVMFIGFGDPATVLAEFSYKLGGE